MEDENKLRVPYASPGLADKAIDIFRRMSPPKITSKFIVGNGLATAPNAFKIMDTLKWLGIINPEGDTNEEIVRNLKLVGDDKRKFMNGLVKNAYKDIIDSINLLEATKDDVTNFIVSYYNFGQSQAQGAATLFLHFCQTYDIPIAEPLMKKVYRFSKRPRREKKIITKKEDFNPIKKSLFGIKNSGENDKNNLVTITINAPGIHYPLNANNKEEFEEIINNKLPKVLEGLKNFLELSPEFNNQPSPTAEEKDAELKQ